MFWRFLLDQRIGSTSGADLPHRYWRIYAYGEFNGSGVAISIAEMQFRSTPGGANLTGSGTPSASGESGGTVAANAFDSNNTTYWSHEAKTAWLAYDFGVGVSHVIREVVVKTRSDTANGQLPSVGVIQYSDDGSNWYFAWAFGASSNTTSGSEKTYTKPTIVSGTHRYWMIICGNTHNDGGALGFSEVEYRETASGADVTGSGTPGASSTFSLTYSIDKAFDNNNSTFWASASRSDYTHWIWYDFGAGDPKDIKEISIASRPDASWIQQYPTGITLAYSDDGVSYIPVYSWITAVPTATNQAQIFTVPS